MNARLLMSLLLLPPLLTGCGTLARPNTPEITHLYLDGGGAEIAQAETVPQTLLVAVPRTLPGYATPRIAYMEGERQIEYYGHHEWTSDPARMLQPAATRALERGGRFAAVVASPSPAIADLRLDMEVIKLLHDYRHGQAVVELVVRAQLTGFDDRRVIATRLFEYREAAGMGPVRAAAAADRALATFLEDLAEFCVEHTGS